jgi:serine/threonine protein kinase
MADSDSLIGRTVSHHRIIEESRCGGMGLVYKAEDTRLNRFVHLKFMPEDLAQDRQSSGAVPGHRPFRQSPILGRL